MSEQDDIAQLIFKLSDGADKPGKYLDDVLMRLAADALTALRKRVEELERVLNNTRADAQYRVSRLTTERDEERNKLRWHVRHIQSHGVVAAFEHWDIAKAYIARGYEIGHWKPHELELVDASQALTRHAEKGGNAT